MTANRKLPEMDLSCPKCGNGRAYGPEYRRGADDGLGEHLRRYCTQCRFMTVTPTADQDTPERQAQLDVAFRERMSRPRPSAPPEENFNRRDVQQAHRSETSRRPYGWNRS